MENTIILVKDSDDLSYLDKKSLSSYVVYSYSISAHKLLEEKKIKHKIAEEFLSENERNEIFEIVSKFHFWHNDKNLKDIQFDGVIFFSLLDTIEFHTHLMNELINFYTTKNIFEKINPDKIIATEKFSEILQTLNIEKQKKIEIVKINFSEKLLWENIQIKQNLGKIPISFNLSRKNYNKIKSFWEKSISMFYNLWFDFKDCHKKTIIFLEFYPPLYEKLISNLRKNGFNIVFLNRRRPAVSDKKSINTLKNLDVKIINFDAVLNTDEKTYINSLEDDLMKKLNKIFSNEEIFSKIFTVNGISLWNIVKNQLMKIYKNRVHEYVSSYYISKKILEKINIHCIMTLNEVGETEKVFLAANKNQVKSILLEHGFAIFLPETKRYVSLSNYPSFNDKMAVWSPNQKTFLENFFKTQSEKIIVSGSPRHDKLFENKKREEDNTIRVLIAPTPITQIQGFDETKFHLKFERFLTEICSILKNKNVEMVLKLHPSQSYHNETIKNIVKNLKFNISIHLLTSITDLIESSDAVITITPEGWGPSTIILESIILKKPIMNIILDNHFYNFPYVQQNAILIVSDETDLNDSIEKLVFNSDFRNELIQNGQQFVKSYLYEPGNASEQLAKSITSFSEN